jgi:hypothetical protein
MQVPQFMQRYFQQIRPLSACDAEDGRIVGRMLKDLVESKPKDLAHAIRTFASNTAMLRESGFRYIGVMLEHLLTADAQGGAVSDAASEALDRSSVTEKQAIAIGGTIAETVRRSHVPATAVRKVVNSRAVLRAMNSDFVWFVPMLEVLVAQKVAESGRSTVMRRLSSLVKHTSVAPIGGQSDGGEDDGESGFSSVVRCPQ